MACRTRVEPAIGSAARRGDRGAAAVFAWKGLVGLPSDLCARIAATTQSVRPRRRKVPALFWPRDPPSSGAHEPTDGVHRSCSRTAGLITGGDIDNRGPRVDRERITGWAALLRERVLWLTRRTSASVASLV